MTNAKPLGGRMQNAPAPTQERKIGEPAATPAFPDEIAHLADIKGKLEDAIQKANDSVERYDKEYMDVKRYMVEHRGDIDPHEMFQNELALKQIDHHGVFVVEIRDKLAKLLDSPYFARIDFREGKEEPITFYIGRFAFSHDNELLISDWRSPVACFMIAKSGLPDTMLRWEESAGI